MPHVAPHGMESRLDTIVVPRDQQLRIINFLDEVCLGIRGQSVGAEEEYSPIVLTNMAHLVATSFDVLWALFKGTIGSPSTP